MDFVVKTVMRVFLEVFSVLQEGASDHEINWFVVVPFFLCVMGAISYLTRESEFGLMAAVMCGVISLFAAAHANYSEE